MAVDRSAKGRECGYNELRPWPKIIGRLLKGRFRCFSLMFTCLFFFRIFSLAIMAFCLIFTLRSLLPEKERRNFCVQPISLPDFYTVLFIT